MKLMRAEAPAGTVGNRPHSAAAADRPTFLLALSVPAEWQPLAASPEAGLLDRIERTNAAVLGTLLKNVDLGQAPVEDEALAEALKPLRVKLDMVIDMLARISYRDRPLPMAQTIELGLSQVIWTQDSPLAPGSWLLVNLYFSELFREPVVLAARLKTCVARPDASGWDLEAELTEMAEDVGESFARLMFLEHRRQVGRPAERARAGGPRP